MSSQEQEKDAGAQVREPYDIPQEELAKEAGDDEEAEPEEVKALEFEAVRPWRVALSLNTLLAQINTRAPNRSKASDGSIGDAAHASRNSDHNPWIVDGGVGVVTARDFTHDAAGGCDANAIAEGIRSSRDPRVKYIIFNKRIASSSPKGIHPAWAWRQYTGPNGHTHHIHVSVKADKPNYDSTTPWGL